MLLAACTSPSGQGDAVVDSDDSGLAEDSGGGLDTAERAADDARVRALTELPTGDTQCQEPMLVRFTQISDGDTAYAEPESGGAYFKVRFIGIDTPELAHSPDPAECFSDEATAFTTAALLDRLAWLTFDAECLDVYDRTLAYVIRGDGDTGFHNRVLARNGYASALAIDPNTSFEAELADDVTAARREKAGLWENCR